jgi:hypothetical protein
MLSITTLLAIVAIILGIITGFIDKEDELLFNPLTWFVLAIAFNTLEVTYSFGRRRSS